MADIPEPPSEPTNRPAKEYEDPHYHDDEDVVPVDDGLPRGARVGGARKPARRIPPPKRRFHED
jgi:hypothetical protein